MARKNEELLKKLSALKPSTPTRTRSAKKAKGNAGVGSPGTGEKGRSSSRVKTQKEKPSSPGAAGKKADRAETAAAVDRKGAPSKGPAVKAVKVKKIPESAAPIREKAAPDDRAAEAPVTPPQIHEGLSSEPESPFRRDAWKAGFFQSVPGMDWATFGDASLCRRFWFDGWLRCNRLMIEVADLHWKVMLGLMRPWPGGR